MEVAGPFILPAWRYPTVGTVTTVSASVPSFLNVVITNPTVNPAINITYNTGVALPVTSGGTGLITAGTAGQVLTNVLGVPAWQTPLITAVSLDFSIVLGTLNLSTAFKAIIDTLVSDVNALNATIYAPIVGLESVVAELVLDVAAINVTLYTPITGLDFVVPANTAAIIALGGDITSLGNKQITLSTPSFLSVTGSPITLNTGGTFAISYNTGTPLPVANGGTGLVAVGAAGTVLSSNGTVLSWTPALAGTVTSVAASVPSFLTITGSPITASGTLAITYNAAVALPIANGGTGLITVGGANTFLTSNGTVYSWLGSSGTGNVARVAAPTFSGTVSISNSISGAVANNLLLLNTSTTINSISSLSIGNANTAGNAGQIFFTYQGANAATNILTIGFVGGGGGKLVISNSTATATTLNTPLTITGTLTATTLNATSLTASQVVFTDASKNLVSVAVIPTTSGGTGLSTVGTAGQVLSSNGTSLVWALPSQTTTGTFTAVAVAVIPLPTTQSAKITIVLTSTAVNTDITLGGNTLANGAGTNLTVQEAYEQFQRSNGVVVFTNAGTLSQITDNTIQNMFEITIISGATTRKQFFTNGVFTTATVGATRLNGAGYLASTALSLRIVPTTGTITGTWTIT